MGFGFEVEVCVDGQEAWDALNRDDAPEIAIIDWMMPGMNGIEFCQKVREGRMATNPYLMLLTVKGDKIRGFRLARTTI